MTPSRTDTLIDRLATDMRPVRPLRAPALRALIAVAVIALVAGLAIIILGDIGELGRRYAGHEALLALEMAAMLATGVLAIIAAFFVSIPGGSNRWLAAPIPSLAIWLLVSGVGCYGDFVRRGGIEWELGESMHCLLFILATSAVLTPLLIWRLARAKPINPLPVALLGGLGIAATSAFVLIFFHPFAVTFIDLAVHLVAILIVVGAVGLLSRPALDPA